jgi:enamine deaminase RidA (YjgF/YER057c/UK114 family)
MRRGIWSGWATRRRRRGRQSTICCDSLKRPERVLAALRTTVYVASTDRADLTAVWEIVQASPLAAAASTLLGVAVLGHTEQLVEIEAIAVLP